MNKTKKEKEIYIRCFGQLAIYVDGKEQSARMNSLKARELIAFLLTCKGDAVKKDKVCGALWENKPIEAAKDNLYKLVKKINQMPIPFKIKCSRGMIQLCLDNIKCDLIEFERLTEEPEDIKKKEWAVELYQGTLYEDEDYEWIYLKEGSYDNKYIALLEVLLDYYEQKGNKRKSQYYNRLMEEFM